LMNKHDTFIIHSNNLIDPKFSGANGQNKIRVVEKYLLKD